MAVPRRDERTFHPWIRGRFARGQGDSCPVPRMWRHGQGEGLTVTTPVPVSCVTVTLTPSLCHTETKRPGAVLMSYCTVEKTNKKQGSLSYG
ncbi:MAG: hypothetical protein GX754_13115 [Clostridiaceae bacterium]|nr:hypothetical protein [Clostridiaceae bacterium]